MIGGGLAGLLGAIAAKLKGGAGVGEVMEAVALGKGRISLRLTVLKALGSLLAIISGGSVGREGPLIQFGGGLGSTLGHAFGLRERQIRALIAAARRRDSQPPTTRPSPPCCSWSRWSRASPRWISCCR